jgi:hypothetical protein
MAGPFVMSASGAYPAQSGGNDGLEGLASLMDGTWQRDWFSVEDVRHNRGRCTCVPCPHVRDLRSLSRDDDRRGLSRVPSSRSRRDSNAHAALSDSAPGWGAGTNPDDDSSGSDRPRLFMIPRWPLDTAPETPFDTAPKNGANSEGGLPNEPFVEGSPPYEGGVRGGFGMARQQPSPSPSLVRRGSLAQQTRAARVGFSGRTDGFGARQAASVRAE